MTLRPLLRYAIVGGALLVAGCTAESEIQPQSQTRPETQLQGLPADQAALTGSPAWIGLYTSEQLDWLENENRLTQICGDQGDAPSDAWTLCADEALRPQIHTVPVHDSPRPDSPELGVIEILATPGQGLSASYLPAVGDPIPFTPDLYLQDWGYGPYFHQSSLAREQNWVTLPVEPFAVPVWLDLSLVAESAFLEPQLGEIVTTPDGDWIILGIEDDGLLLRAEQPADMFCEDGEAPTLEPTESIFVPNDQLRDDHGHLTIRPKYSKGC